MSEISVEALDGGNFAMVVKGNGGVEQSVVEMTEAELQFLQASAARLLARDTPLVVIQVGDEAN